MPRRLDLDSLSIRRTESKMNLSYIHDVSSYDCVANKLNVTKKKRCKTAKMVLK
jgi:hypothetical protein